MENDRMTYIGKWIRWRRKALGLSQAAFLNAHPLCSRKTLSLLENGKSDIRLDLIEDLLLAFDVRLIFRNDVWYEEAWNALAEAYAIYDVPAMEARINAMKTQWSPFARDLFCRDALDFLDLLRRFLSSGLSFDQAASLWRFLEPVWPRSVQDLALAMGYGAHLSVGVPFEEEKKLSQSEFLPNRISYGYRLWETDRRHLLSVHINQLESEVSYAQNPIRTMDLWILKLISFSKAERSDWKHTWNHIANHFNDVCLDSKRAVYVHNLTMAFFEKDELKTVARWLATVPDWSHTSLALRLVAIVTFSRLDKMDRLSLCLVSNADDPGNPQYPYLHYFRLKYEKGLNADTLLDTLVKDVWPLARDDSFFGPVFERELRELVVQTRRYRLLTLL